MTESDQAHGRRIRGVLVPLLAVAVLANIVVSCLLLARVSGYSGEGPGAPTAPTDQPFAPLLTQLSAEVDAVSHVDATYVVTAARLWRRSQLALEAGALEPDAAEEATKLENAAKRLQDRLVNALSPLVQARHNEVSAAPTLKAGLTQWAEAGAVLALFPDTGEPELAGKAQELAYEHERVRQDLLAKHQTRYNLWACSVIKKAWVDIKEVNAPLSKQDNELFVQSCLHFLGPVDASLLDVATGELYREVLRFVRERLTREHFQELVEGLENAEKRGIDDLEP